MKVNLNNIRPCKYKVNTLNLTVGTKPTVEIDPKSVTEIYIEKEYDSYALPYLELTASVPNSVYREIKKEGIEIRAFIHLQYGYGTNDMSDQSIENIVFKDMIRKDFYVFSDDATPEVANKYTTDYENSENLKYGEYGVGDMSTVRLLLYNEEYLFRIKEMVNVAIQDCDVTSAIAYVLNKARIKNVLCSPATNNKKFVQIIIPPYATAPALTYLANTYGMHDHGTSVFFDWDIAYILNKNPKNTAWQRGDIKTTTIMSYTATDSASSFMLGCYEDNVSGTNVINIESGAIKVTTESMVEDQAFGSNFLLVNSLTGDVSETVSGSKISDNATARQTILMTDMMTDTSDALSKSFKELSKVVELTANSININMLKPNLEYKLIFDNSKYSEYSGSYRIVSYRTILKQEGNALVASTSMILHGY